MSLITLKRSAEPGKSPSIYDLVDGELAVNTTDGAVFLKRTENTVSSIVKISNNYQDLVNAPTDVSEFNNDAGYISSSAFSIIGTNGTGFVGTAGTLTFDSNYGMSVTANGSTLTVSTPQDLQHTASPAFSKVSLSSAANSTSTSTGALTVLGGVGIGGTLNVGNNIHVDGIATITANGLTWTFNDAGKLVIPTGGDIVNINGVSVLNSTLEQVYAVRYDIASQNISEVQRANARANIDAPSTVEAFIYSLIM